MDKYIELEQILNINTSLIEIIKDYCEFKSCNSDEISNLKDLVEILFDKHKKCVSILESIEDSFV